MPDALHHPSAWGAEPQGQGLWRFALWAPGVGEVALELDGARTAMERGPDGVWRVMRPAQAGEAYGFVVDGGFTPDPFARAQAGGDIMGPSRLVDPRAYAWGGPYAGRPWEEAVLYELHVGTFTPEGTFAAAAARMADLAALGITAVEVMPVAHFPGQRGWGYDGALLAAPHPAYGTPDDMRRFVEAAQAAGIMVILDVVLNHFSPEGSDMQRVVPEMFDREESTPWGAAIAFKEPMVRAFFRDLCLLWLTEYRLDGLRLDAVHEIRDPDSETHFLVELARAVRGADLGRPLHLVTEDSRNIPDLREPDEGGGKLYDAEWNDDFHHSLHCLLTDERHSYLASFAEDPTRDLVRALSEGYAEAGQPRTGGARGAPAGHLPFTAFVNHNQNHDQTGNHPGGRRLITIAPEEAMEVAHALLLTGPFVPMLFMGEEAGSRAPFHYFTDVDPALALLIQEGRQGEFGSADGEPMPNPNDLAIFVLSHPFRAADAPRAAEWRDLTRRLLAFRRERVVPLLRSGRAGPAETSRVGPAAVRAEWPFRAGRLIAQANLGTPPDVAPAGGPHDLAIRDVARDPFAFAVSVVAA